jgi:hypothetical protein
VNKNSSRCPPPFLRSKPYPTTACVFSGILSVKYAVHCTRKHALIHSTGDMCNDMVSRMKRALEGNFMVEIKSRYSDPSELAPRKAVKQSPLGAIAAITQVLIQDSFHVNNRGRLL